MRTRENALNRAPCFATLTNMRRLSIIACTVWMALLGVVLPSYADKRVALVIGNSAYRNAASLTNPANDAVAISGLFKSAHFDTVRLALDLGIADLRRAISEFADLASDADIAVVYYAGHGIEMDGTNYLIPIDARFARDFDVDDEAVTLDRVLRAMEPARRLRLVILDACRDNPFANTMRRTIASRSIGRGLARVEPAISDTLIAFSAKAGSIALDEGGGRNSPFTSALLKHLATPNLGIGDQLANNFQLLRSQRAGEIAHPGQVAARPIETRDEACPDGIAAGRKDYRNRCSCPFGGLCRGFALCEDYRDPLANKIGSQQRNSVKLILRSMDLDRYIAALGISGFAKPLAKGR